MKKISIFVLAFAVLFGAGMAVESLSYAELQIDRGQTRGASGNVSKYFVARNGRALGISADRVVIWDTTSNDGVTVTTTTTSHDNLVVGVTIDAIPGTDEGNSSDVTAANQAGGKNWGRVRVYGRHADVSFDSGAVSCSAGSRITAHSGSGAEPTKHTAGQATILSNRNAGKTISNDVLQSGVSGDSFGVALEDCAAANKSLDVFINKG